MQVSNTEITVSNEIAAEVLVGIAQETSTAIHFTDLQCVGGGTVTVW
jgi:hypothetical protein